MDTVGTLRLRVGDMVELRPGAPVPTYPWLRPGVQGRVLLADGPDDPHATGEVTVVFPHHASHPIRLHRRWLRFISRPRGRGRPPA